MISRSVLGICEFLRSKFVRCHRYHHHRSSRTCRTIEPWSQAAMHRVIVAFRLFRRLIEFTYQKKKKNLTLVKSRIAASKGGFASRLCFTKLGHLLILYNEITTIKIPSFSYPAGKSDPFDRPNKITRPIYSSFKSDGDNAQTGQLMY